MNQRLGRCLHPASVAVVGGREVERVVAQCRKLGYGGKIHVVNPRREEIGGIRCLPSIDALPEIPDAAFVAIPAEPTIDAVRDLATLGVGGVVCYASGFREVGAGDRHQRLLDAAGAMPLIGPNCYGYVNALNGAVLWPDQHGMTRRDNGVAIFSASGNISVNLTMQRRGLPLAFMLSIGNQAMIGVEDCLDAMLDDDRIRAVGLLVEGLRDLPRFVEVAARAAESGKPVVLLKNGRSEAGARMTMSHTATLAGESALYDALFRRLGVAQVTDLETFLEALKLLSHHGPLPGTRIASLSCSGGEASMIADLAVDRAVEFPALTETHRAQIQETLNEYVHVDNPLDYHTFIWGDPARLESTFSAMLAGGFDLTVLLLDYPCTNDCDMTEWLAAGRAFASACRAGGASGALIVSLPENVTPEIVEELSAAGVPVLLGIPQALGAIEAAGRVTRVDAPLPAAGALGEARAVRNTKPEVIGEFASKQLLAKVGLKVPAGALANDAEEAVGAARSFGYPVALKLATPGLAHKTEAGGVRLGLADDDALRAAAGELLQKGAPLLVERMAPKGVAELLLGVASDPQFGHYLVVGLGGTLVELFADRAVLLPPVSADQVRSALLGLRSAPLLQGFRGAEPADLDAVVDAVLRLADFAVAQGPRLTEVDINPLIVHPEGAGATVADALIVY